jgi:peptidyl-prolyl cis-trans isomerase B (cyclophilin B)
MANSGPHTNGSQFFLVYQNTTLPPNYTIWGRIVRGLDIVQNIAALGTTNGTADGAPKQPIAIQSVTVK